MKKKISGLLILGILLILPLAKASDIKVEEVVDLQALSTKMQNEKLMLVLEFHAKHCAYCKQLEEEILKPMLISGDYNDLVAIKQLALDSEIPIIGFDGKLTSGSEMGKKMNIIVTPTLVFLDSAGKEVSERIVGINTPEMFGAYVDAAIDEARLTLPADVTETKKNVQPNLQ